MKFDVLLKGGRAMLPSATNADALSFDLQDVNIGIKDGKIVSISTSDSSEADHILECRGLTILPGIIDSQVHFREPGLEHKEDLESGTRAALMGGVTSVFEMPNTKPPTTTPDLLQDKISRAQNRAWCNIGFYLGGTKENTKDLHMWERLPGCVGIKVFMGSSTGTLLPEHDDDILALLRNGARRATFHAEDNELLEIGKKQIPMGAKPTHHPVWRNEEIALRATQRLIRLARQAQRKIHVLHVSSQEELEFLSAHKDIATVETTPQFLSFDAPEIYERLGTLAQMNPPIRSRRHREALWRAVNADVVDIFGSDHAPHTLEEKQKPYPESPSGMPGVQTILPVMLTHVAQGRLSLSKCVHGLSVAPAAAFGAHSKGRIAVGYDADLTIVDLKKQRMITNSWIESKSQWTPFDGFLATGWPVGAVVGGHVALWDETRLGAPHGRIVDFL